MEGGERQGSEGLRLQGGCVWLSEWGAAGRVGAARQGPAAGASPLPVWQGGGSDEPWGGASPSAPPASCSPPHILRTPLWTPLMDPEEDSTLDPLRGWDGTPHHHDLHTTTTTP